MVSEPTNSELARSFDRVDRRVDQLAESKVSADYFASQLAARDYRIAELEKDRENDLARIAALEKRDEEKSNRRFVNIVAPILVGLVALAGQLIVAVWLK